jgi:protein phosphatase
VREAVTALKLTSEHNAEAKSLLDRYEERMQMAGAYVEAYRRYCWPVHALGDFKLAPFHLLASEGAVHIDKDHLWHMQTIARFAEVDRELFLATPFRVVNVNNESGVTEAVTWWEELTASGGEGMVVKPLQFVIKNKRDLVQPAVQCRGREYLRIIYGPEYTAPHHLERLRARGLVRAAAEGIHELPPQPSDLRRRMIFEGGTRNSKKTRETFRMGSAPGTNKNTRTNQLG